MGQYFLIVNMDKKEYIHPHKMGSGLKLLEITFSEICRIFPLLLRKSSEGGGGDADDMGLTCLGRWAGDRIVVIGDYDNSKLYRTAEDTYKDISIRVRNDFKKVGISFGERWDKPGLLKRLDGTIEKI